VNPQLNHVLPLLVFISVLMFVSPSTSSATGCEAGACLQVGPRLASLDTQQSALLNPLFSGLLGSNIALNVAQSDGKNDLVTALGLLPLAELSDTVKLGDLL
jgi:uncharacterized membrane protein